MQQSLFLYKKCEVLSLRLCDGVQEEDRLLNKWITTLFAGQVQRHQVCQIYYNIKLGAPSIAYLYSNLQLQIETVCSSCPKVGLIILDCHSQNRDICLPFVSCLFPWHTSRVYFDGECSLFRAQQFHIQAPWTLLQSSYTTQLFSGSPTKWDCNRIIPQKYICLGQWYNTIILQQYRWLDSYTINFYYCSLTDLDFCRT